MIQQHPKSKLLPQTIIVKELPMRGIERTNKSARICRENQKKQQESVKNHDASSFEERLKRYKNNQS